MEIENIKTIHIEAKRWFQSSYGNTYHSVLITINWSEVDELEIYEPFTYGYDSAYIETASKKISELLNKSFNIRDYWNNNGSIKIKDSVIDVKRKKDL